MAVSPLIFTPVRTLLGAAGIATRFNVPTGATDVIIRPETSNARYSSIGADAGPIGTDYLELTFDQLHHVPINTVEIFIASVAGATIVEVYFVGVLGLRQFRFA